VARPRSRLATFAQENQEHEHDDHANHTRGRHQRRTEIRIDGSRAKRNQLSRAIAVHVGVLALQHRRERRGAGLRLCDRRPRGQASDHAELEQPPLCKEVGRIGHKRGMRRKRHPEIDAKTDVRAGELARHHADHGGRRTVQSNRLTDDRRIGAEASRPEAVRENRDRRLSLHARVGGTLRAPARSRHAKDIEVISRDDARQNLLRLAARRHVQRCKGVRGQARESPDASLVVEEVRIRDGIEPGVPLVDRVDRHQPILVDDWERTEEQRVNQTEGGGRGADPKGQGEKRRYRESALSGEDAQCIRDILPCRRRVFAGCHGAEPGNGAPQRHPRARWPRAPDRLVEIVGERPLHLDAVIAAEVEWEDPGDPPEQSLRDIAIAGHSGSTGVAGWG
jgi:hypothetical protein